MSLRECIIPDRSQEISEQAVADLNACLEQLLDRCRMIESNIDTCTRQAQQIANRASSESPALRVRSLQMLRQCLMDRQQHRLEYDRASRSASMLRRQIGTIVNSHVDTAIIHAMRQYSAAAAKLGLPDKTNEVQRLTYELNECIEQSNTLQDALGEVSTTFSSVQRPYASMDDNDVDLEAELEAFLSPGNTDEPDHNHTVTAATPESDPPPVSRDDDGCGDKGQLAEGLAQDATVATRIVAATGLRQRAVPMQQPAASDSFDPTNIVTMQPESPVAG